MPTPSSRANARKRQAAWRARARAEGLVTLHTWVRRHQLPELNDLIAKLHADPDLLAGPAIHAKTRKLVSTRF